MSKTARGKQYTFEDVARLVCKGADPPEGLVRHLRSWARPVEGFPKIELEPPLGRKQMVDALKDLSAAADVILRGLAGQPMKFIMAPKYPPFDRILLIDLLWDLKRRCHDSVFSPPLSSPKGGVKRGPGHVADPDGTNLMVFCAGAILLAWRVLHGVYPGSQSPQPKPKSHDTQNQDTRSDRIVAKARAIPIVGITDEKSTSGSSLADGTHRGGQQCRSANLEGAIWKFRRSVSAAWA
jgi:hypothetical protein